MDLSISFHSLVKLVDAQHMTNGKNRTLNLPLEINETTSKVEAQGLSSGTYDPNPEVMFAQKTRLNNRNEIQFRKHCKYYHESKHFVSNCFLKQRQDKEAKRNSSSRSKSLENPLIQYFKAYQNQYHPAEQTSSYPVNCFSRNSYDLRNHSTSRN